MEGEIDGERWKGRWMERDGKGDEKGGGWRGETPKEIERDGCVK